jgi:hypothetical protein
MSSSSSSGEMIASALFRRSLLAGAVVDDVAVARLGDGDAAALGRELAPPHAASVTSSVASARSSGSIGR